MRCPKSIHLSLVSTFTLAFPPRRPRAAGRAPPTLTLALASEDSLSLSLSLQGYLAYKKRTPPGPCRRPMPRVLVESWGDGRFFLGEVPLHLCVRLRE